MTRYEAQEITFTVPMPQRARNVFLAISSFSNKNNACFPSVSTIARRAQVSESTVHRAIAELIALGLLEKVLRTRSDNGNSTNCYIMTPPVCQTDTPGGVNLTPKVEYTLKQNTETDRPAHGREGDACTEHEPPAIQSETEYPAEAEIQPAEKAEQPNPNPPEDPPDIPLEEVLRNCELDYIPQDYRLIFRDAVTRLYYSEHLRIGKNIRLPQKVIRESMRHLNHHTLEAAWRKLEDAYKNTTRPITNSSAYVLTLLYNSISEEFSDLYLKPIMPPW